MGYSFRTKIHSLCYFEHETCDLLTMRQKASIFRKHLVLMTVNESGKVEFKVKGKKGRIFAFGKCVLKQKSAKITTVLMSYVLNKQKRHSRATHQSNGVPDKTVAHKGKIRFKRMTEQLDGKRCLEHDLMMHSLESYSHYKQT